MPLSRTCFSGEFHLPSADLHLRTAVVFLKISQDTYSHNRPGIPFVFVSLRNYCQKLPPSPLACSLGIIWYIWVSVNMLSLFPFTALYSSCEILKYRVSVFKRKGDGLGSLHSDTPLAGDKQGHRWKVPKPSQLAQ